MKSQDVFKLKSATTIQGKKIHIDTKGDVKINTASILKMDIECKNGIMHIIDEVLIPI